jgi:hypothetical protein
VGVTVEVDELETPYLQRIRRDATALRIKLLDVDDNIATRLRGELTDDRLREIAKLERQRRALVSGSTP